MSTLNNQLYIDAVIVYGIGRTFSCSLNQLKETAANKPNPAKDDFEALDLTNNMIRFRVLGSGNGDGTILLEKIVSTISDPDVEGSIEEPTQGVFTINITPEDTKLLGRGSKPITIEIIDAETEQLVTNLTEGGTAQGEFNKITIVNT